MPLLDHFRPPLFPKRHWESFHVAWAGSIGDALNGGVLPDGYFAEECISDPDSFEMRVRESGRGPVGAVKLVSPANKDREAHRSVFAAKCAGYLAEGIGLIVVDIVTTRLANLHAAIMGVLNHPTTGLPTGTDLYAVAYRPVVREGTEQIEVWAEAIAIGRTLPTLPLFLTAALAVPIDLEATYSDACQRRRIG